MNDSKPKRGVPSGTQAWLTLLAGILFLIFSGYLFAIFVGVINERAPFLPTFRFCALTFVVGAFTALIGLLLVLIRAVRG